MSARTTLTAAIAARLATGWGASSVFVGVGQANELEAPCVILTPGDETPKSREPLGNVEIQYSIAGYRSRLTVGGEEYTIIDDIIDDIRAAVEACGTLPVYSITYSGASPIYSEAGGDIVGAELRYSISTPYVQNLGD